MSRSRTLTPLIPMLLGGAALAGNYLVLAKMVSTVELVVVGDDIKPGAPLTAADLRPVPVRADEPLIRGTIRYDQRDAVLGKTVRRKLVAGELLLRGDVEHEAFQIDPLLLAGGEKSLTLPARAGALGGRPQPGAKVELYVRPPGGGPAVRYGPYTFLGWVRADLAARDPELVYTAVGVREGDPRLAELRAVREASDPHRLVSVEVVRPLTMPR